MISTTKTIVSVFNILYTSCFGSIVSFVFIFVIFSLFLFASFLLNYLPMFNHLQDKYNKKIWSSKVENIEIFKEKTNYLVLLFNNRFYFVYLVILFIISLVNV